MPRGFYNEVTSILRRLGFEYWKQAKGSHEKWRNPDGLTLIVPHNLMSRHTANGILKSAGAEERL